MTDIKLRDIQQAVTPRGYGFTVGYWHGTWRATLANQAGQVILESESSTLAGALMPAIVFALCQREDTKGAIWCL
ncbi:MAG: hypothetical protein D6706_06675 [Chloroflexi bacterium]|nr:MAG: hypothetical protein D6706_06675 [Chloroflexota bacterium]